MPQGEEVASFATYPEAQRAVDALGAEKVWVNPDCGLKTRGYAETEASLTSLVGAARAVREA